MPVAVMVVAQQINKVCSRIFIPDVIFIVGLGLRIRSKRKTFDQLTKYGKRKSMVDVRALLSRKQKEYMVPVSKLAGYVIQQVKHDSIG